MATFSLLSSLSFLLLLLPTCNSLAELWNIDCGASAGHNDYREMEWISDYGYVHSGESHELRNAEDWTEKMRTLRSFPKAKKNCYSIPVGKGRKIQVRTRHLYGNYDGLQDPPYFSVPFESIDPMIIIGTDMSMRHYHDTDFTYVTPNGNASICLGREDDAHDPIINALQVTVFDTGMYSKVNSRVVLRNKRKVAFGVHDIVRYPEDPYDRWWRPVDVDIEGFNYAILVSNGTVTDTSAAIDQPPAKIFTMAATTPDGEMSNLTIRIDQNVYTGWDTYINLYFSEVTDLAGSEEKRSFHVYLNDKRLTHISYPIVPPFNGVLEKSWVIQAPSDPQMIILVPTPDSTLPPIISGMEIFRVEEETTGMGTHSSDVEALKILQDKFAILKNWSGDPCLPEDYNWEWVNCSRIEMPRVEQLHLGGYGLEGSLPNFSGLEDLKIIDLHNNKLNGSVPEFLAKLPHLEELNVAYNNFSGYPHSLKGIINVTGNPMLDISSPSSPTIPSYDDSELPPDDGCEKISLSTTIIYLLMMGFLVLNMI